MKYIILILLVFPLLAYGAGFQGLGQIYQDIFYPSSVSNNGVISGSFSNEYKAVIWAKESGYQRIGEPHIGASTDITPNGLNVVGYIKGDIGNYAFRWDSNNGLTYLPHYAGQDTWARAHDIASDGSVIVGHTRSVKREYQAIVWYSDLQLILIGDLPGGTFYSIATSIAKYENSLTVVGISDSSNGKEAFKWDGVYGMVGLGDLAGGSFYSSASNISDDASTIIGISESNFGNEAFLWNNTSGMVGLGDLPGGGYFSEAFSVSFNGSLIVGMSSTDIGNQAFIWDENNGMRNLKNVLTNDYGLNLTGWTLTAANAISSDGLTIAGYGINVSFGEWEKIPRL